MLYVSVMTFEPLSEADIKDFADYFLDSVDDFSLNLSLTKDGYTTMIFRAADKKEFDLEELLGRFRDTFYQRNLSWAHSCCSVWSSVS